MRLTDHASVSALSTATIGTPIILSGSLISAGMELVGDLFQRDSQLATLLPQSRQLSQQYGWLEQEMDWHKRTPAVKPLILQAGAIFDQRQSISDQMCLRLVELFGRPVAQPTPQIDHPSRELIQQFCNEFFRLLGTSIPGDLRIVCIDDTGHQEGHGRSYYLVEDKTIHLRKNADRPVVWHELGHWLEHSRSLFKQAARGYQMSRATSTKKVALADLDDRPGYHTDEMGYLGNFLDSYIGKVYEEDGGTEVLSMGFQFVAEDLATLYDKDRSLFFFAMGTVVKARQEGRL
jgi:hypothetical protein